MRHPSLHATVAAAMATALSLGLSTAQAEPVQGTKTMVCTSSGAFVSTFTCPALDPKVGKLVSVDAALHGSAEIEVEATSADVGTKTIAVEVDHTIDLFGFAFHWPGSGSAIGTIGPQKATVTVVVQGKATKTYSDASTLNRFNGKKAVTMVVSADIKKVSATGASITGVAKKGKASFMLTYNYVPVSLAAKAAAMPPIGPVRAGDVRPLKDLKPVKPMASGVLTGATPSP